VSPSLDEILKLVSNVGFPIFIAVWLLIRTDKFLREMTLAVKELTEAVRAVRG
jgi:hypothetical protein